MNILLHNILCDYIGMFMNLEFSESCHLALMDGQCWWILEVEEGWIPLHLIILKVIGSSVGDHHSYGLI